MLHRLSSSKLFLLLILTIQPIFILKFPVEIVIILMEALSLQIMKFFGTFIVYFSKISKFVSNIAVQTFRYPVKYFVY